MGSEAIKSVSNGHPRPTVQPTDAGALRLVEQAKPQSEEVNKQKVESAPLYKTAVITGAGSGFGLETVRYLSEKGFNLAVLVHSESNVERICKQLNRRQDEIEIVLGDVTSEDHVKALFAAASERWGSVDVVFANAGINGVWAPLEQLALDEWDKTMDTNLKGTFLTLKTAVPFMREEGGSIIITSSINGNRVFSNVGATAYSTAKAAQVALMKMAALELAEHKIRVNAICPGSFQTGIEGNTKKRNLADKEDMVEFPEGEIPLTQGEPGDASKVAELVAFLASDHASHITGTEIYIDGAQSLIRG